LSEQQLELAVHVEPGAPHVPYAHLPLWQRREQHSVLTVQALPVPMHAGTHAPWKQFSEQQSSALAQASPSWALRQRNRIVVGRQPPVPKQTPQHGDVPHNEHGLQVGVLVLVSHERPEQQGRSALHDSPLARHTHVPPQHPDPEQHWLEEVQVVPCTWHAVQFPAAQNMPEQHGRFAPQTLPWLTQPHSPE
jgi:hypothetical protein